MQVLPLHIRYLFQNAKAFKSSPGCGAVGGAIRCQFWFKNTCFPQKNQINSKERLMRLRNENVTKSRLDIDSQIE